MLLTGCRLGVVAVATVEGDGSGTAELVFHLDEPLLDELDALGVDPTAELQATMGDAEDWTLDRRSDQTGLTLVLRRAVADAEGFGRTFQALSETLADEDPALLVDLEVLVGDDGAANVAGDVSFRPPASVGAAIDGEPLGPDGAALAAIVEGGVVPQLVITLPGRVSAHDADHVDGRTLTWDVPVGETRTVGASSAAPTWLDDAELWWAVAGGILLLVAVTAMLLVRRRRDGRAQP